MFIDLCRQLKLFTDAVVAIDGSKFKTVNNLDKTDGKESDNKLNKQALEDKIASLKEQMRKLQFIEEQRQKASDKQVSLTDPDSRSMTSGAKGKALVGYNVQSAVDTKNHLIVSHKVTNESSDRAQLSDAANQAQKAMAKKNMTVLADKG